MLMSRHCSDVTVDVATLKFFLLTLADTTTKISIYDTSFMTLYKQCHYLNIIECTMSLNLKRHNLVYF